jgi:hypothetical protein
MRSRGSIDLENSSLMVSGIGWALRCANRQRKWRSTLPIARA